jgi:hypothetical protein
MFGRLLVKTAGEMVTQHFIVSKEASGGAAALKKM